MLKHFYFSLIIIHVYYTHRIQSQDLDQDISEISIELSAYSNGNNCDFEIRTSQDFFPLTPDPEGSNDSMSSIAVLVNSGTQIKSISFEEYNGLLNLFTKISLLEETVEKLKNNIKEKDELIERMKQTHKSELETKSLFPNLTDVSKSTFQNMELKLRT